MDDGYAGIRKGTDQIRAEFPCKGLGGVASSAPNSRPEPAQAAPPRGILVARTAGVERESDVVEFDDQGSTWLYPVRRVRCSAVDGA